MRSLSLYDYHLFEPFAGDGFKGFGLRRLGGFPFRSRINAGGNLPAGFVAFLAGILQGHIGIDTKGKSLRLPSKRQSKRQYFPA